MAVGRSGEMTHTVAPTSQYIYPGKIWLYEYQGQIHKAQPKRSL